MGYLSSDELFGGARACLGPRAIAAGRVGRGAGFFGVGVSAALFPGSLRGVAPRRGAGSVERHGGGRPGAGVPGHSSHQLGPSISRALPGKPCWRGRALRDSRGRANSSVGRTGGTSGRPGCSSANSWVRCALVGDWRCGWRHSRRPADGRASFGLVGRTRGRPLRRCAFRDGDSFADHEPISAGPAPHCDRCQYRVGSTVCGAWAVGAAPVEQGGTNYRRWPEDGI